MLYVNPRLAEISGYAAHDMSKDGLLRALGLERGGQFFSREAASRNGEPRLEAELLRKDGSLVPVEVNVRQFQYGDKPASLIFIRDMSERKRAAEFDRFFERERLASQGNTPSSQE